MGGRAGGEREARMAKRKERKVDKEEHPKRSIKGQDGGGGQGELVVTNMEINIHGNRRQNKKKYIYIPNIYAQI